ncbi:MAG TPA: fused MFS/spermidine synthase [Chitinophagales bacterium]|nr:fused MFS/spermidine synthase [Chitinophagales bacterium]
MKPAWYLVPLSYLFEIPIEKRHSAFSATVKVSLHRGEWKLSTFNAIYSFGKYYSSYKSAFRQIDIQRHTPTNTLILGVGLGSVVKLLLDHPTLKNITAVDIDPVIIELAKKYWPDTNSKFETVFHTEDAIEWLENRPFHKKYDLILSDIFIDDKTPKSMLTRNYLNLLKESLNPNGILLYSKINYTEQQQAANSQFEKTFKKVFPNGDALSADYNLMYIYQSENKK